MSKTIKLYVKNLSGQCCMRLIETVFANNDIELVSIKSGQISFNTDNEERDMPIVKSILSSAGMDIIKSRDERTVEQIKQAVYELIFEMNNVDSIAKKSEYIVEKLGMNYRYLSRLFSKYEETTLEKYIIQQKIERIKQLIIEEEFTLSEIAYMMDYASAQYLSTQFKKETGMTFIEFKNKFYE